MKAQKAKRIRNAFLILLCVLLLFLGITFLIHRIQLETKQIERCEGAVLVPKGNGWYTVQIPLNNVDLNLDPNEAKGPANGDETLSSVHFKKDLVSRSFLVDNFRLETAAGNSDLNGDGVPDKLDVKSLQDSLTLKGAPPQNVWEADLDHNGRLDVVDTTLLKQRLLTQ